MRVRAPDAAQREVLRRRSGAATNAEFVTAHRNRLASILCHAPPRIGGSCVAELQSSSSAHDRSLLAIGAACAAGGVYFVLVGFGTLPPPSKINGPLWLSICVGLVFLAGGVMVLVRGWLNVPDAQDLPADAPRALIALQWIATVAASAGLATAGTWVAFGDGPRQFVLPIPLGGSLGEIIGRAAFGLGAVIAWLITLAFARVGAKKVFEKKGERLGA